MAYTKQTWGSGTTISQSKLEHIEDGISDVESESNSNYSSLNSALADYIQVQQTTYTGSITIENNAALMLTNYQSSPSVPSGYTRLFYFYVTSGSTNAVMVNFNSAWCKNVNLNGGTTTLDGFTRYDVYKKNV